MKKIIITLTICVSRMVSFCQNEDYQHIPVLSSGKTNLSYSHQASNYFTKQSPKAYLKGGYSIDEEFGSTIIAISPLGFGAHDHNGDGSIELGMSYERITSNGRIGLKLPVVVGIAKKGFYINPVLKIYIRRQGTLRYAVGPQFLAGSENQWDKTYSYNSIFPVRTSYIKRSQFGLMANNSLNLTLLNHIYIGADLALGVVLVSSPQIQVDPNSYFLIPDPTMTATVIVNAGFQVGIRF